MTGNPIKGAVLSNNNTRGILNASNSIKAMITSFC
jgi:hypothetical protein